MKLIRFSVSLAALLSAAITITSCGGSNNNSPPATSTTATITGSVFAAPVAGATVVVLNSTGTTTVAGPVTTANDGTYSVSVPIAALASDLIISSTSGTFTDEATGTTDLSSGNMAACVAGGSLSNGSAVHLDPSSTVIADLVKNHGLTLDQAKTAFSGAFGYTPDTSVAPNNAPSSTGATAGQRLAALRALAFSQLTKDLGLTPDKQFDLLAAIAQDLADDGTLNGSALVSIGTSTMPEDIMNRMDRSIVSCLTNTTMNMTGLTTADIGALPFGKIALTNTYKVEYVPDSMAATQGKSSFTIMITNRSGGSPATGLTVSLMPMMHMATMKHATPIDSVVEDANPGTYKCTVYYLMASGMGMGYWELQVKIGGMMGETATFYPRVGMAMGSNTVRTTLRGQSDDLISTMTGSASRTYYLFKDGMTTASSINLYLAAQGNMMMTYPALYSGATLTNEQNIPWTITTMSIEATTDPLNVASWQSGTNSTGGHWSVTGLSLSSGQTNTVYLRMVINGSQKSTDGNVVSSPTNTNGYALFMVTPGM